MTKTIVLCLVALAAFAAGADSEIREREQAWATAVAAGDIAALDKLLADNLIYGHASGAVESKKEYLDRLKTGKQKYGLVERESIRLVAHGDTVVTHSILRMSGTSNGKAFKDHLMMLHVWVKQGGVWRLAAHQTARLAD